MNMTENTECGQKCFHVHGTCTRAIMHTSKRLQKPWQCRSHKTPTSASKSQTKLPFNCQQKAYSTSLLCLTGKGSTSVWRVECIFLKNLFIYLFIFWLCWVFVSVRGLSLVVASGGHSSSWCVGLSLSCPLLLWSTGSRCTGSVVVTHGPSRSVACGIFPDRGTNPCPLPRQADSQPLCHQGSPRMYFCGETSCRLFSRRRHTLTQPSNSCCWSQLRVDARPEPVCLACPRYLSFNSRRPDLVVLW